MPARKIILLVIALLIAGATVFLARQMLASNNAPGAPVQQAVKPMTEILVAAKDLPAGTLLKEADVKWTPWPAENGLDSYAVKGKATTTDYLGTVVRSGLRTGEPLMTNRVVKPGQSGFMAAALVPGLRAVSISLTPVAGVAGFVFPGDHVDVLVTHQVNQRGISGVEATERKVSETILTNVRVLALDQKMDDQVTTPKVAQIATLEVSPKQAESVALAAQMGSLSLSLRSIAQDPVETPTTEAEGDAMNPPPALQPISETGLTWDSDVSRVLPSPANRNGAVQKITIIRGKDVSESVYDLTQPQGAR